MAPAPRSRPEKSRAFCFVCRVDGVDGARLLGTTRHGLRRERQKRCVSGVVLVGDVGKYQWEGGYLRENQWLAALTWWMNGKKVEGRPQISRSWPRYVPRQPCYCPFTSKRGHFFLLFTLSQFTVSGDMATWCCRCSFCSFLLLPPLKTTGFRLDVRFESKRSLCVHHASLYGDGPPGLQGS